MAEDSINQVKERLNIVDVVSGYIKVQKSGVNFKARCPFHNEKTPSFYISPERQIWHCFGCQKGGDIFSFVKELEGIEFGEALKILAQRAGVKIERFNPELQDAKTVLFEICETATRFFEKQLYHSSVGKQALAYLKDRGLTDNSIKEFRLGFAPDGWHNLDTFLRDCGYASNNIVEAGLAIKKEGGGNIYDRFRSRIIFPISDINDRTVGFTGRFFNEFKNFIDSKPIIPNSQTSEQTEPAKYINTSQTLIYDKSRILYGLNKAKLDVRRNDCCLLVEGNMDVIMSYQAGVKNVAGTSGTALTPSHLQLLQRYTKNLDFCFDTDQAGAVATRRGIGLALSQNFNIKIVHLDDRDCKDPADYVKKFSFNSSGKMASWKELTNKPRPVLDFYFDKLKADLDLSTVDGKKLIIANLAPFIIRLASRVERSHWISRLASIMKTKEENVEADINQAPDDLNVYESYSQSRDETKYFDRNKGQSLPEDMLSQAILMVLLRNPSIFKNEIDNLDTAGLDLLTQETISKLKETVLNNFDFDKFVKQFKNKTAMKLEFVCLKSQELFGGFENRDLKAEFQWLCESLRRKTITSQLTTISMNIKEAEAGQDKIKLGSLLTEFNELSKKLAHGGK